MTEVSVDPSALAAKVAELAALEARDPTTFAEALADNIMEPDPVETAAFRSDDLAFKSLVATRYLIENTQSILRRRRRGSVAQRRTEGFIQKVGRERRVLENIVNGIRARTGVLPNTPNPRQRAMRRLWNENMKGPVPAGRYRELLNEEVEAVAERKRQAKKARQEARKAERAALR